MKAQVTLPALDGRDPLGFLAALGVLRVIASTQPSAQLSFSPGIGTAILHSTLTDIDAITMELAAAVSRIPENSVLENTGPQFPLRKPSRQRARDTGATQKDPMRVVRNEFRTALRAAVEAQGSPAALEWLDVLVTDLGTDNTGRAAVTPFNAPSGQQSLWTFFEKPLAAVQEKPEYLKEALTGWRRVAGFTGEYLDHRVLNSAADHPSGRSSEAGVPGPTWLAIQALLMFRLTGDGTNAKSTLWHRAGKRQVMIWPLWRQALDQHAVCVLLEHPLLGTARHPDGSNGLGSKASPEQLSALGIFSICGAQRVGIEGRKSAGALAPINVSLT